MYQSYSIVFYIFSVLGHLIEIEILFIQSIIDVNTFIP